jgi:hypothetical protein
MYTFTFAAHALNPHLSLDMALLSALMLAYLYGGALALEEKKLIAEFGRDYEVYRRHVPALLPWRWFTCRRPYDHAAALAAAKDDASAKGATPASGAAPGSSGGGARRRGQPAQ